MSVLGRLRAFLGEKSGTRFADDDYRLAAAILLIEASQVDGVVAEAERERIAALLPRVFDLDAATTAGLIAEARRREAEGTDLQSLSATLLRVLDEPARRRMVALLWDVARADGTLNEFEETLVWRVAALLEVPDAGLTPPDPSA